MDEDLGVKAPVTRLRRRMSVEAEDSPLPTTPSTPTKKRSTRLAAKPQLELIDEIATENIPKKTTRKVAVKENEAEPIAGTPTAAVTPSRRSTRIRSNTSILSETTAQNVESPRAKRALRRTSQLGSDTESAAVTPARQTRRTTKDSAAIVDKPVETADENVVVYMVSSTNMEDSSNSKDSKENRTTTQSPSSRKSPRNHKKGGKVDDETDKNNKESNKTLNDSLHTQNTSKSPKKFTPVKNTEITKKNEASPKVNKAEENVSTSSINLMNEIKQKNVLNKSIEKTANDLNSKRNRTKSSTTLSSSNAESISDIRETKEKIKSKTPNTSISGSGDGTPNSNTNKQVCQPGKKSPNSSVNTSVTSMLNIVTPCIVSLTRAEYGKSDTVKLFENLPNEQQPLVLIEDSDSCSVDKLIIDIQAEGEHQCVPEVATNKTPDKQEQSVEPMDIDETVPINVTIDDYSDKSNTSKDEVGVAPEKRKTSVSEKSMLKDDINKSKRKSSMSIQTASESRKVSISKEDKNETMNKSKNSPKISSPSVYKLNDSTKDKSNRTSSISQNTDEIDVCESNKLKDKSLRKSSISEENNAKLDESANKCKRESYNAQNNTVNKNHSKISLDNTQKNLSMSFDKENIEELSDNSNKSKRNSSISLNNSVGNQKSITHENNDSKSSTKSKKNSISQIDLQSLENKSTLVISQLKDVSRNETNNIMSPNVTDNELSKSLNGPDVKTKGIDKINLNYLTSTPIQQKSHQKVAMQINTSIISPAVEKSNEKTPKKTEKKESFDSNALTDEEIKFKNKEEIVFPQKKISKMSMAPSSSESSDDESDTEPQTLIKKTTKKSPIKKQQEVVDLPKKKFSRAPSSSESSDDESDTEPQIPIKKPTNKSPIKKQLDKSKSSSDSEKDSDTKTRQKNINTSSKKLCNESKTEAMSVSKSLPSDSSDSSDDLDEEPSRNRSKMVDDEASEASDDYESGDSQNEEDRRYEEEHEVVEKGETLDSEEELSNDSDYEKDSFLVSSDADDRDMLSGTGDDLCMSDNELTMSAKSKRKFNERKNKQQKKASREMFEARHKNDESANNSKSVTSKMTKRQRLESSNLESENENTEPKKSHRLRIDSSQDSSIIKSDADESIGIKKKKSKRLSESVNDITINEKEITICNQSTTEKCDPLAVAIKLEPKTPQKNFDISSVAINNNIEEVQVDANASILRLNNTLDPLEISLVDDDSSSSDNMEIMESYDSVLMNLNTQNNIKTADTSLNLNRKTKKSKEPVIDQLNFTQTKNSQIAKESSKVVDENSSDSIDMKLLFPEDSNNSDINASQFKPKIHKEPVESFIPLKRTDAQTNIPGNMDNPDYFEEPEDSNIRIIIDTVGTHGELENSTDPTNSKKKKKKKSLNESTALETDVDIDCTDGIAEKTLVESSFISEKKKKKNKNKSFDVSNVESNFTVTESLSQKKSKKKYESTSEFLETQNENTDKTIVEEINVSIKSDKKKNKHKHDASQIIEPVVEATISAKKKSKKTSLCVEDVAPQTQDMEPEEMLAEISMTSEKKKRKKNKQKLEFSQTIEDKTGEESDNDAPVEMSYRSEKKSDATDTATDEALISSEKKKHKKNKKKKNKKISQSIERSDDPVTTELEDDGSTKRKRKASGASETEDTTNVINPLKTSNEMKKRRIQQDNECIDSTKDSGDGSSSMKSKKNKKYKNIDIIEQDEVSQQNTKKRKHRDDDNEQKVSKVSKQNSFDKIHVPVLPESVINQLSEKPQNKLSKNKKKKFQSAAIATMPFVVEEAERRKNKPSNYLEQSIYLNDTPVKTKQKRFKDKPKPKVLPFIPTALTSDSGYTSQFNINLLPRDSTQFVAQASNVDNFRESFLVSQRIKKMGTLERFKAHRSQKISKF